MARGHERRRWARHLLARVGCVVALLSLGLTAPQPGMAVVRTPEAVPAVPVWVVADGALDVALRTTVHCATAAGEQAVQVDVTAAKRRVVADMVVRPTTTDHAGSRCDVTVEVADAAASACVAVAVDVVVGSRLVAPARGAGAAVLTGVALGTSFTVFVAARGAAPCAAVPAALPTLVHDAEGGSVRVRSEGAPLWFAERTCRAVADSVGAGERQAALLWPEGGLAELTAPRSVAQACRFRLQPVGLWSGQVELRVGGVPASLTNTADGYRSDWLYDTAASSATFDAYVASRPSRPLLETLPLPRRVLDTRGGNALGPGGRLAVDVRARGGLPVDTTAVLVVATAVAPSAPSWLAVLPGNVAVPETSSLNVAAGETRANTALVPIAADGTIAVYNSTGSVDVLLDVTGFVRTGSVLDLAPAAHRVVDTRTGLGISGALTGGAPRVLGLRDLAGLRPSDRVVFANITVTATTAESFLTLGSVADGFGAVSTLNWLAGRDSSSFAVLALDDEGRIAVRSAAGEAQLVIDVVAAAPAHPDFVPVLPRRVFDTRSGVWVSRDGSTTGPMLPGQAAQVSLASGNDLPTRGLRAAVLTVTSDATQADGYVTLHRCGAPVPPISHLNPLVATPRANTVVVELTPDGAGQPVPDCVEVANGNGVQDVVLDLVGYLTA